MLQPENQPKKYLTLFADIDTGRTKIPMFQRDFVWSDEQTARLIDSIIKGFPIGAFIFWQTRDELRHIRNIGNIDLPDTPKGESRQYVLDGQQRITSLYAVRKGVRITREGDEIDYKRISIDLSRDPDAEDQIVTAEPPESGPYITVFELLNGTFAELAGKFDSNELRNRIDVYRGRLPVSRLLPYDAILVPLTYFFIRNEKGDPSADQDKLLTQYFWWASLSNRFTSAAESKIAQDLLRMDSILVETPPSYAEEEVHLKMEDLRWHRFRAGEAFCKAILCLYAFHEPKSFQSNGLVKLDNSWLRVATSKNYHHFFPKDYLAKTGGFPDERANSILNITLVDDYLNKRRIRAKAPSVYMESFAKKNKKLKETMKTHLIDDLDAYGVWDDNYSAFIEHRGHLVLEELESRLRPDLE